VGSWGPIRVDRDKGQGGSRTSKTVAAGGSSIASLEEREGD